MITINGKRPEAHATLRCPRCARQVWKPVSEDKTQYGWQCLHRDCVLSNRVGFPIYNADGTLSAFAKRMGVSVSEDDGQPE